MNCLVGNMIDPFPEFHADLIGVLSDNGFDVKTFENLKDFLLALSEEKKTRLLILDTALLEGFSEERLDRLCNIKKKLGVPFVCIGYTPGDAIGISRQLEVEHVIYKYYDCQRIWYVVRAACTAPEIVSKRKWKRFLTDIPLEVIIGKRSWKWESFDLGGGGVFIRTYEPVASGEQIKVALKVPSSGEVIECEGRVVYSRPFDPLHPFPLPPGMGVEFTGIGEEARRMILEFLQSEGE